MSQLGPARSLLCVVLSGVAALALAAPAGAAITGRGTASAVTYASDSTTSVRLAVPAGAQAGDLLLASIGVGRSSGSVQPALTAPAGWTLVSRTDQGSAGTIAVYRHVLTAGETAFTWTTSAAVGGTAYLAAFGGVDTSNPVSASSGRVITKGTSSIATPSVTTTAAGSMLVASYYGYRTKAKSTSWAPPSGMTELGDATNSSGTRSGSLDQGLQASAGASGAKTAVSSNPQDDSIAVLTALEPAPAASSPPAIGAVSAGSVGTSGATIAWTTDQPADSQVEYGQTTSYGSATPVDSTAVTGHSQQLSGLAANTVYHYRVKSRNAAGQLTTSGDFTFQTAVPGAAVPLIVDTDIFSDADDVGALATAFGLQIRGEARVVAVGVNTRTSRPAVATNSWKCVAAVDSFYNSASVPIGASPPSNGTSVNTPDFVGPCARLAPASTPAPDSAVNVFRRALAAQPDGSVVIAEAGYQGNLAALVASPPDSISPLSGRDLVAKKVRTLVAMGGGYPSRSGENNLIGDPAAAQSVSTNWPTKIVWSGYEVGDQIHTGNTISSIHPASSPVRVSYEAFVAPGNWIYSYDLTAIYHAIRPADSVMTEVGPGTNVIDSSGGNRFVSGSGNQYYLKLGSASALDASIETLLDTLPASQPADTTPPSIGGVSAGSPGSSGATISWSTDETATTQVEYGTSTAYGSVTALDGSLVTSHSQALSGLAAGTLYHYRVKSRDAAGNTAVSGDFTFTTAAAGTFTGPNDSFDSNSLDPSRWIVSASGSTVAAAGQELEITHPAGPWTKGSVTSATAHDQRGRSLQLQMRRAANNGLGGSTYGETTVYLTRDGTHWVSFFAASGSLTAWSNSGGGEMNLTPSWPGYNATNQQWLRFREAGGTIYWETAAGATAPGPWTTLASAPDPFAMDAVKLQVVAGANVNTTDTAKFDSVATG
jgi:inosine-uridine nucleoside N-ribohydrolase